MDKRKFFEAIYAACTDEIVSRRRGLLMPLCVFLAGILFLIMHSYLSSSSDYMLCISLMILGIADIILSFYITYNRLLGDGEPYSVKENKFLCVSTISFDLSQKQTVLQTLKNGDIQGFYNIPKNGISALSVMIARSFDDTTIVAMVFQYVNLEYIPVSDIIVVHRAEADKKVN